MPYIVDRISAPVPLVKAADHSGDHNHPRGRDHPYQARDDGAADDGRPQDAPPAEEPAVLLDTHHDIDTTLGGVAAYQETARHLLAARAGVPGGLRPAQIERRDAQSVRHAYEDHDGEEPHTVNVAT